MAGPGSVREVFLVALRLGLTSFGGPIAHIGYFRAEYVRRRGWLDDDDYADLVALCQALPGPASSQVGIAIGTLRAGIPGGLAAWLGFTLPSALLLIAFALGIADADLAGAGWVHGLKIAALAVVAQAVVGMWRSLAAGRARTAIAVAALAAMLIRPDAWLQVGALVAAGVAGIALLHDTTAPATRRPLAAAVSRRVALACLAVLAALLVGLPLAAAGTDAHVVAMADGLVRTGALVFGGGHVILPLLDEVAVGGGWLSEQTFLAGYGATQAVPGPLTTFAAYLGAAQSPAPNGVVGGLIAVVLVFVPAWLLVIGALPFWDALRRRRRALAALAGVNAGVVGILGAALYDPIFTAAVRDGTDLAVAVVALAALTTFRVPPWAVVLGCAAAGALLIG